MKKILHLSLLLAGFAFSASAQVVNIPDPAFKATLLNDHTIDTDHDGEIQVAEAAAYTDGIYLFGGGITDLTGLEAFTAITELYCEDNTIDSLDLSYNTALVYLDCTRNTGLVYLNVSQNVALEQIYCSRNEIESLDVSHNAALLTLMCDYNRLTALDLSQNPLLEVLVCASNLLGALDVSANTALQRLVCSNNRITSLDLSGNPGLIQFRCAGNLLQSLNLKNGQNTRVIPVATGNPDLVCVQVDDVIYSMTRWADKIDSTAHYSENCACPNSFGSDTVRICPGTSYLAPDSQVFTQQGQYYYAIPNVAGCDSIVSLTLVEESPELTVFQNGTQLSVQSPGWTDYDWYDCEDLSVIVPIAHGPTFTATRSGLYAVLASRADGCSVLSGCYNIAFFGTDETEAFASVSVYPNPADETVYIGGDLAFSEYRLADALGRVSESRSLQGGSIPVSHLAEGVYHLQLVTSDGKAVIKRIVVAR